MQEITRQILHLVRLLWTGIFDVFYVAARDIDLLVPKCSLISRAYTVALHLCVALFQDFLNDSFLGFAGKVIEGIGKDCVLVLLGTTI